MFTTFRKILFYIKKTVLYVGQFGVRALFYKIRDKMRNRYMDNISLSFSLPDEDFLVAITKTKSKPSVNIIIVTFNNQNTIEKCISSILTSSYENIGKIIIVDNNSHDQTIARVKKLLTNSHQNFLVLDNKKNLGFGEAVNFGVNHSNSDLLLFLNPDAVLYPDTISVLVDNINNFGEKCALIEARQIPFESPKLYNPISMDVIWCSGCCMLVRKKPFIEVGGFDKNIFLYGEDVDLSWRLKSFGYLIKYCPTSLVYHEIDPYKPRLYQKKYGPLSNLYLRVKYGEKVGNWFLSFIISIMKRNMELPNVINILSCLYKGWLNRFPERKNLKQLFPTLGFGYEILRRRGHNTATLPFPQNNLVSVIIRTHNRTKLLRRTLISVFRQSYKNIEVIVVEDNTDTAPLVIQEFKDLLDIRYFKYTGTKGRRSTVLNVGLLKAQGDWIYILDDDDVIFADTIETLLFYAHKTSSLVVYGGSLEMLTDDKWTGLLKHGYFHLFDREKIKKENFIPIGTFIFHHLLLNKVGIFDEKLETLEDWDFLRRLSKVTNFTFVPKDFLIFLTPLSFQQRVNRQLKLDASYKYVIEKD